MWQIYLFYKFEMLFTFFFGEVMNLRPVIVPYFKFLFRKLLIKLLIIKRTLERGKSELRRALNHRLALAVQWKDTVMAFIGSKLFGNGHHRNVLAISYENGWLTWCHENKAVLWIIDIDISCYIEDEVYAVFAIVNIKLLLFYWVHFLNLESRALIFKTVIIWIILLTSCFRLQNKCA